MELNDYQLKAESTAQYNRKKDSVIYPTLGLAGEAGEMANKVKKVLRDEGGVFTQEKKRELAKELGDVLWYVAIEASDLGFTLEEIAQINIAKLASRKERGKICGSGDDR